MNGSSGFISDTSEKMVKRQSVEQFSTTPLSQVRTQTVEQLSATPLSQSAKARHVSAHASTHGTRKKLEIKRKKLQ